MRTWLINLWDSFRTGFWFMPTLLILGALALAVAMPIVDRQLVDSLPEWLKTTGDTARSTLAALASAMFTVAGVVFSVTVVTLSITSSQLGPRLLRNFLEDNTSQLALGSCVACSIYCLILLWRIDDSGGSWFVPHLSVALATAMTLAALCIVVLFIHSIAHSVQSMYVVAEVAADLDSAITRLFPEPIGEKPADAPSDSELRARFEHEEACEVHATSSGYLQAVNGEVLLRQATEHDLLILLECQPGRFLVEGHRIARYLPGSDCEESTEESLSKAFLVGNRRTPRQDVECAVSELVEVAVRALSPGINDPFTAVASIDRLTASFCRLSQRTPPAAVRVDGDGRPRIITRPTEFPDVLRAGFDQIRQYGASSIAVSIRLLEALRTIAVAASRPADHEAIYRQAKMVVEGVRLHKHCDGDLEDINRRFEQVAVECGQRQGQVDDQQ